LNPELAEAHASLATVKMFYDWDFAGAEKSFLNAIKISPECVGTRSFFSVLLCALKRFDEAIAEAKRYFDLDPLNLSAGGLYGAAFLYARRYQQALEVLKKIVVLEPRVHIAHGYLGFVYAVSGQNDEAITCLKTAISLARVPVWIGALGYMYGVTGKQEEASRCLKELETLSQQMYVDPGLTGMIYLGLGDLQNWRRAIEELFNERIGGCILFGVSPLFDSVRSEPFFQNLCRRIGLP
jgi:tetratricopeptide (TPR) repeat protein